MSKFFIDRPIFAWVIAIVLMMFGTLAVVTLPVAQYPSIAPPAVAISVIYPGASADTVQSTVVQVIEQQLSGLDHLLYFSSESDKDGSMTPSSLAIVVFPMPGSPPKMISMGRRLSVEYASNFLSRDGTRIVSFPEWA